MTYDRLIAIAKPGQLVTFGFRGYVYNSSPVSMVKLLKSSTWLSITAIDPPAVGRQCGGAGGKLPAVNTPEMEEAARRLKFITVESWTMPNGREFTMWKIACPRDESDFRNAATFLQLSGIQKYQRIGAPRSILFVGKRAE